MDKSHGTLAVCSCAILLCWNAATNLPAQQPAPVRVPIVIVSDSDVSPCDSVGEVQHLDPKGDNFLSVQSGPGGKPYAEIDRLRSHDHVRICGEQGNWWSVVYGPNEAEACKLARPKLKQYIYAGPCKFGWVAKKYVVVIAG